MTDEYFGHELLDGMGLSGGRGTPNLTMMNTHTQIDPTETHATIKLGIDAHAKWLLMDSLFHPFQNRPNARPGIEGVRFRHLRQRRSWQLFDLNVAVFHDTTIAFEADGAGGRHG